MNVQFRNRSRSLVRLATSIAWVVAWSAIPSAATPQVHEPLGAVSGVDEALVEWRRAHGSPWRIVVDDETGFVRFLHGGNAAPSFTPAGEDEFFVLARQALEATRALHGVDADTLQEDQVMFLPLGNAGSTDKLTVQFRQRVDGVPVIQGYVNLLFDTSGRLLSIDVTGLPRLSGLRTTPAITAGQAVDVARQRFADEVALPITRESRPELVIDQVRASRPRTPRLAWQVELYSEVADSQSEGFAYLVDAVTGEILRREARVHSFDVSGRVESWATPGTGPDVAGNPEQIHVMKRINVAGGVAGQQVTDASGNFNFPGAFFPLQVAVAYSGPYCNVTDDSGASYSQFQTLNAASGNVITMNPNKAGDDTAEANAFRWVTALREWIVGVNPGDLTANFQAQARVNVNLNCNANFSGTQVNFYSPGAGCENSAYSSIVIHEMGHWLNVLYGSGNPSNGFGEGNADVFALYVLDHHLIGEHFNGPGNHIRTAENMRQFCGDSNLGCHNAPHADGEVLMGALWKVRQNLKASFGSSGGGAIANTLFNSWMLGFNDFEIKTIIQTHWMTLDDNDGNLSNGTPHFSQIDGGFRVQGFPGPTMYVDYLNTSPPWWGSDTDPFPNVTTALANTGPGGVVVIRSGTYTESPITINQNVRLSAPLIGSTVTVR